MGELHDSFDAELWERKVWMESKNYENEKDFLSQNQRNG